jgi:predicted MFS family arabinose efflux permease
VPFSLYLAKLISWHAPFLFIGILGIFIIPLIIRFMPPIRSHLQNVSERKGVIHVLTAILSNKSQVMALSLTAMLMFGHFLVIPFINPYLEFNVGFTKEQTPLIYMVGGTGAMISSNIIGRMADRFGKLRIFIFCMLCSLIPIFLITNMPPINFYLVLGVFGFWFIFSTGRNIPAQAMISTVVNPAQRGQFMSFNSSFQQLFTGMASIVSGLIVKQDVQGRILHYNWVGYLSAAVVFSTLFLANKLAKRQQIR